VTIEEVDTTASLTCKDDIVNSRARVDVVTITSTLARCVRESVCRAVGRG
jgi:hypothetical protein